MNIIDILFASHCYDVSSSPKTELECKPYRYAKNQAFIESGWQKGNFFFKGRPGYQKEEKWVTKSQCFPGCPELPLCIKIKEFCQSSQHKRDNKNSGYV